MMDEELKQRFIAKLKSGARFKLRECSICNYNLVFFAQGDNLFYDTGCDCTRQRGGPIHQDWAKLDFYLEPEHGHIPKIEEFCKEAA